MSARASVIMLAYNQLRFTQRCVAAVRMTPNVAELILVDNGSQDSSLEWFHGLERDGGRPPVRVLHHPGNPGMCRTRNAAARIANGDVLVFVDNDTYAPDLSWLSGLLAALDADPVRAMVGPLLVYPPDGSIVQAAGGGITPRGHVGLLGRGLPRTDPRFATPGTVAWLPTACMAVRADAFWEANGFDETLDPVATGEDIDLCLRIRSRGHVLWLEPSAWLIHFENVTANTSTTRHLKRDGFLRHMKLYRERWLDVMLTGPLVGDADIRYIRVRKNYTDLDHPLVAVSPGELGSITDPDDGKWL